MKNKAGACCMLLGAVLLGAALSLFVWNRIEDAQAQKAVEAVLPQLAGRLAAAPATAETAAPAGSMTEVEIDGSAYIGCLSIPALGLELPVMAGWDESGLKTAPCRYAGAAHTGDLVIAGHNYARHFGTLKSLEAGDSVYFTDMDGVVFAYEVLETEILPGDAVEAMTSGDWELTLFTCTYSGQSRFTVRCGRVYGDSCRGKEAAGGQ